VSQDIFDDAGAEQALCRFSALEQMFDAATVRALQRTGIVPGFRCLEVGGGGGSIARWLARTVAPSGHVIATDVDPRFIRQASYAELPNLEVIRHDIALDALPEGSFDLIHERLVLQHVPAQAETLATMIRALKPGGWLVVEDFDHELLDRSLTVGERASASLRRVQSALSELMSRRGSKPGWARGYHQRLIASGLVDVGAEGALHFARGGSAWCELERANLERLGHQALEAGLLSADELASALAALAEPAFTGACPLLITAWGRRPAAA
jgi:ubiquinone/menaquinone biosynthesis C-methylase UbiE